MIKTIVVTNAKSTAAKLRNFTCISEDLIQKTKSIMDDVEKYGDSAVIAYTEKLDGVQLSSLKVTEEEILQLITRLPRNRFNPSR